MAIDTLKMAKRLREAGFSEMQAEAVVATVQDAGEGADFTTKRDLDTTTTALRSDLNALRNDLDVATTALRNDVDAATTALRNDVDAATTALRNDLDTATAALRNDLDTATAALRNEIREAELRGETRIEAAKAEILSRVFGMILGALVVNIVAIVGAMFGVAKLLGH